MNHIEPTRRERKKEDTRRRILEVAIALFREKGFEATTVDEISEKADVGRATFFNYFPKKESVLAYLSESRLESLEERARELLASPGAVREKIIESYLDAARFHEADPGFSRYIFDLMLKRAFKPTHELEKRMNAINTSLILQGQEQGELRSELDPARAGAVLLSVYMTTIMQWAMCDDDCIVRISDLRGELRSRIELVLDGLASPKEARA